MAALVGCEGAVAYSLINLPLCTILIILLLRQKVHHLSQSLFLVLGSLILQGAVAFAQFGLLVSTMAKIFKYISQIFVVKEREMEIGFPTDVKHVAHIGWDGPSDSAPSWMNEFKNGPDFSTLGRNNTGDRRESSSMAPSPWASQDFEQSMGRQPSTNLIDLPPNELASVPKKPKRKKVKSSSSSSSSSRSSRPTKTPKATYTQMEPTPNLLI